jgi:hypothetical protein
MDNQQEIQWFSGFFEGEGCQTFSLRKSRGLDNSLYIIEPKISISNTEKSAIDICKTLMNELYIIPNTWVDKRKDKLPCYTLEINKADSIEVFTRKLKPFIECDRERLVIFNKFCQSRLSRIRYSKHNDYEWQLYKELQNWRSSEAKREESYNYSLDWLAGIYEAEGSFVQHSVTGSGSINFCNTNVAIVSKVQFHLEKLNLSGYYKRYPGNERHQPHWHIMLHGKNKSLRFINTMKPYFRFRKWELEYLESKIRL